MKRWYKEFQCSRNNLTNEFREDRPRTAVVDETIAEVGAMIEEDRLSSYLSNPRNCRESSH